MTNVFIDLDRMEDTFNSAVTHSTVTLSDIAPNISAKFMGDQTPSFSTESKNPLQLLTDWWDSTPLIVKGLGVVLVAGIFINFIWPLAKSKR